MRILSLLLLVSSFWIDLGDQTRSDVLKLINESGARTVAVAVYDEESASSLLINEHQIFHAASTMKLPVMMRIFELSEKKVLALDWDRLIPGHPGAPAGRLGTRKDVEDDLALYQEASAEMKKMGQDGKCWDTAEKEFKLPKYESWPGYASGLPFIARRYCGLWGRGT